MYVCTCVCDVHVPCMHVFLHSEVHSHYLPYQVHMHMHLMTLTQVRAGVCQWPRKRFHGFLVAIFNAHSKGTMLIHKEHFPGNLLANLWSTWINEQLSQLPWWLFHITASSSVQSGDFQGSEVCQKGMCYLHTTKWNLSGASDTCTGVLTMALSSGMHASC